MSNQLKLSTFFKGEQKILRGLRILKNKACKQRIFSKKIKY